MSEFSRGDRVEFGSWGPGTVKWDQPNGDPMVQWDRSGGMIAVPADRVQRADPESGYEKWFAAERSAAVPIPGVVP